MPVDLFDRLLQLTAPEEDDLPIDTLLKTVQQEMQPPRVTTPIYEYPPELKSEYEKSAPFPIAFKADVNTKKGIVTAYLTTYLDTTGQPYIDPYNDIIESLAFNRTVQHLEQQRKNRNNPWLVPDLWQHDKKQPIGGIKGITLDSRGPIYEAHLFMGVQQARDALAICEQKGCGSSFGYDPVEYHYDNNKTRHLTEVRLHEVSQVTFPANDLGQILGVKSRPFYVPSNYHATSDTRQWLDGLEKKSVYKSQQEQRRRDYLHACRQTHATDVFESVERVAYKMHMRRD